MKFISHNVVAREARAKNKNHPPRYWWLTLEEKYAGNQPGVYLVEWSDRNDCLCFGTLQKHPDGFAEGSRLCIKDKAKVSELTEANWPGSITISDVKQLIDEEIKTLVATPTSLFLVMRRAKPRMAWGESRTLTENLIRELYEEKYHAFEYAAALVAFEKFNEMYKTNPTAA